MFDSLLPYPEYLGTCTIMRTPSTSPSPNIWSLPKLEYLECSKIMRISFSVEDLPARLPPLTPPSPSSWSLPKLEYLECSKIIRNQLFCRGSARSFNLNIPKPKYLESTKTKASGMLRDHENQLFCRGSPRSLSLNIPSPSIWSLPKLYESV